MSFTIIQVLFGQLILPLVFIISLWKTSFNSKLAWILHSAVTLMMVTWVFLAFPWDATSYYLRVLWPFLLLIALYVTWKKARALPFRIKFTIGQKMSLGLDILLFLFFSVLTVSSLNGLTTKDTAIELDFPLRDGTYYVGQGGNSVTLNYHNAYTSQQYAIDVSKLNILGMRAAGIYPSELEKYYIFGEPVYSPCSGVITSGRNDLPDLVPPESDPENAAGNHVYIKCDNEEAKVLIAHMQESSVTAKEGDIVERGQQIGRIGNSGNTTEPHLHIHAEIDGVGVPIKFNDRFIVRNSLVW